MRKFFTPNIGPLGRLIRALGGIALVVAGQVTCKYGAWYCVVGTLLGGFVLYEAARGWCVMRACGIRTKV